MKKNNEHIDLIEKYLYDDMTQEELKELNELLRTDAEFNKLFYDMDHLLEGIRQSAKRTSVDEKLATLEESLPPKYEAPVIPIWRSASNYTGAITAAFSVVVDYKYRTAIAAAFTLLIVATLVLFNTVNQGSPATLFQTYFTPFENNGYGTFRGDKGEVSNKNEALLMEALDAYDKENFSEAAGLFDQITINDENKIVVWMYAGNAYLYEGQTEKAKEMFQNILNEETSVEVPAKWYLSLCYLKEESLDKAKPLLVEIRDFGRFKSEEAGKILRKL